MGVKIKVKDTYGARAGKRKGMLPNGIEITGDYGKLLLLWRFQTEKQVILSYDFENETSITSKWFNTDDEIDFERVTGYMVCGMFEELYELAFQMQKERLTRYNKQHADQLELPYKKRSRYMQERTSSDKGIKDVLHGIKSNEHLISLIGEYEYTK